MNLSFIAIALALGFAGGWQVQDWRFNANRADELREAARIEAKRTSNIDTAAVGHEGDKVRIRKVFVEVEKEVERVVEKPVYSNVCLDDDGLRIANAAIGRPATAASQPAPAVPGLKPAAWWDRKGSAAVDPANR